MLIHNGTKTQHDTGISPINRSFVTPRQACFVWSDAVKNLVPFAPKEKAEVCDASAFQFNPSATPGRNGQ